MKQRILGPAQGWYIALLALPHGNLGRESLGSFRICDRPPAGFFDAAPVHEGNGVPAPSEDEALAQAADLALAALPALGQGPAAPEPDRFALESLLYVSRARQPLAPETIAALLTTARQRNREYAVTGMLLLFGGTFMQYLEGPQPHVELVFRLVCRDPVHEGLIELSRCAIARRVFNDWSMAFDAPDAARWVGPEARPLLDGAAITPELAAKVPLSLFLRRHA